MVTKVPPPSPSFPPSLAFPDLVPVAQLQAFLYNRHMTVDRNKPITGKELEALIERGKEAKASLACEGIFLTPEEDAAFAEMNRLGLSYEQRDKFLDEWMHRTYGIPLPDPA
ncbi:MAG: hypothetical protein H8K03_22420 (plasmid) [Nitrospira sp.]